MITPWSTPHHRKRKRRRIHGTLTLTARLIFDETLNDDIAVLSADLCSDLLGAGDVDTTKSPESQNHYIGITPQRPGSAPRPDDAQWTIIAVRSQRENANRKKQLDSSIYVSPTATFLDLFLESVRESKLEISLVALNDIDNFYVNVIEAVPLPLDTVVVSIDGSLLSGLSTKIAPSERMTNGDHVKDTEHTQYRDQGEVDSSINLRIDPWIEAIRHSLGASKLVRSGGHCHIASVGLEGSAVAAAEATIEFCEPVSQGLVFPWTRIVVVPHLGSPKDAVKSGLLQKSNGVHAGNNHMPNSRTPSPGAVTDDAVLLGDIRDMEDTSAGDEISDDSEDANEGLGLSLPNLPNIIPSMNINKHEVALPMNKTRPATGRLFQTCGLASCISEALIHPIPSTDDDEEARVFTDVASLARLGCFSGDWVTLRKVHEDLPDEATDPGSVVSDIDDSDFRVAKIYSLPSSLVQRTHAKSHNNGSHLAIHDVSVLAVIYMSPLLLYNLESPKTIEVHAFASLQPPNKAGLADDSAVSAKSSSPPLAKEVDICKLATPLATERTLQPILFRALRKYFEKNQRIVRTDDLIAVSIDADVAKALYSSSADADQPEFDGISDFNAEEQHSRVNRSTDVAWFRVGNVATQPEPSEGSISRLWGSVAIVSPGVTRMSQKGSVTGKIPSTLDNCWPYYMSLKQLSPEGLHRQFGSLNLDPPPPPYISQTRRRVRELASAATSPQAVHFKFPPLAIILSSTQRRIGKATTASEACADLGIHVFVIDAYDILSESGSTGGDVNTAGVLEARAERAMTCGAQYTALLIKHVDALTAERMVATLRNILSMCRVLIATTSHLDKIPEGIRSLFTHELEMTAPDEGEREGLLRDMVHNAGIELSPDVELSSVAVKTAALVASDLVDVVDRAAIARQERLEQLVGSANSKLSSDEAQVTVQDIAVAGGYASRCVIKADFDVAVDAGRKNFADAIGAPKIPNVSWDDVGGLTNVKDAVMETIQLPLERPELFAKGMKKRSGILFYGPPGTGKTLLAKAIATEFSLNFFSIKGPELLNMYIGESEANVRRVFQRARDARPCVVFFDELDSVAPKRGNQGDSGGVMDRIVSQLLAELDGMSNGEEGSSGGGVFVIGATNRPDLLDQALLRPGRFDKMLYLGVSDTHDKQLTILEALTRKFTLHPDLSLRSVASSLPFTYTGADLYALCSDAMLKAITRRATSVDTKVRAINAKNAAATPPIAPITVARFFDHFAETEDTQVVVETEDFEQAVKELVPSVSVKELEHYDTVRRSFEAGDEKKQNGVKITGKAVQRSGKLNGYSHDGRRLDHHGGDDDFILHTEGLSLRNVETDDTFGNGSVNGNYTGKGKGKGKVNTIDGDQEDMVGFGEATADDAAMYDD